MNKDKYVYIGSTIIKNETIHIGRDDNYFYSGIVTNVGFAEDDEYKIDPDVSLDRNLVDFIEFLEEN